MSQKYKVAGGSAVSLGKDTFVAKGGEGEVRIVGDVVYKVCNPGQGIPEDKIRELAVLDHPRIVRPEKLLLDGKNRPVGYTMRRVPGAAVPLAQILTKAYREREGVTPAAMAELVRQIHDGIRRVHKHPGYLQVDGNEFNYMVTNGHADVYFIDVNSYQTPNHPADAVMASIRDWRNPAFSQLTDWFSFAVISWYMFAGIHPYKHRHPRFTNLKTAMVDAMTAGVSILDRKATFPKAAVYHPFADYVPGGEGGAYMQWYKAVFGENKRLPPPSAFQAVVVAATVTRVAGSNHFDVRELRAYDGRVVGHAERNGREIVATTKHLYVDGQPRPRHDHYRVGFTPQNNTPVALVTDGGSASVYNLETGERLPNFAAAADDTMDYAGRLYYKCGDSVFEVRFIEQGATCVPVAAPVANVMPQATRFFRGVALQDVFGTRMASFFPETGQHRLLKIDELAGVRVTDAKFENNVLMAAGTDAEGQNSRYVFRFTADWSGYDLRKVENVSPTGLNFTVLDSGVAICVAEDGDVEVFSNKKDAPGVKAFADPAVDAEAHLCHAGKQARFARGDRLYAIAMK